MFNRKSIYALNKKDPNATVYTDADGNLIRLTCDDFACAAEFRRWKDWSDSDLRKEENADHKQSDNSISLEVLSEEATAVVSIEDEYMEQTSADEAAVLVRLLRQGLSSHLTETQRRRLWKYCVESKPVRLIAKEECAYRNAVWKSIQAAKEKMFKFFVERKTMESFPRRQFILSQERLSVGVVRQCSEGNLREVNTIGVA